MILAYLPSLLLSLVVLPAYHLRVFDTECLRTVSKAHLVYVTAIHLFVASSSVASGKDVARHFHVAISSTKSLVSNLFLRLGWAGATYREEKYFGGIQAEWRAVIHARRGFQNMPPLEFPRTGSTKTRVRSCRAAGWRGRVKIKK